MLQNVVLLDLGDVKDVVESMVSIIPLRHAPARVAAMITAEKAPSGVSIQVTE